MLRLGTKDKYLFKSQTIPQHSVFLIVVYFSSLVYQKSHSSQNETEVFATFVESCVVEKSDELFCTNNQQNWFRNFSLNKF